MIRGLIVSLAVLLAGSSAYSIESRNIIRAPSSEVLPAWSLGIEASGRGFTSGAKSPAYTREIAEPASKPVFSGDIGLFGLAEVGATWNTEDTHAVATTLQWKLKLLQDRDRTPSFAIGMMGIGKEQYPFPDSFRPADYGTENFGHRENHTWYGVFGKKVADQGSVYAGIGGGKFLGRGALNQSLHGVFGGFRYIWIDPLWLAGEIDGRHANAAIGVSVDANSLLSFTASVKGEFLENLRQESQDNGLRPAVGGYLEVVLSPFSGTVDKSGKRAVDPYQPLR